MRVRDTSLQSYRELRPELGDRQLVVLRLISKFPECTDLELASKISKDANFIRPRRNELVKLGLVVSKGKRKCKVSERTSYVWGLR